MDSNIHYKFREPLHGNTFAKGKARDPPHCTALGTLSENHNSEFAGLTNESSRLEKLIVDSGFPERHLLPPEYSPRAPVAGREWNGRVSAPRTVMSGIFSDPRADSNFDSNTFAENLSKRQISPNQRRRQRATMPATARRPGEDLTSAAAVHSKKSLWRSKHAQRVGQKIVDAKQNPIKTENSIVVPIQYSAFGPMKYSYTGNHYPRLENEANARTMRLRETGKFL
jgi:hypothetical protein